MEIEYDLSVIFGDEYIQRLDRTALKKLNPRRYWAVKGAIDRIGAASAKAQGLKSALTAYEKVLDADDEQVVYLLWSKNAAKENSSLIIGLLKIGFRSLYLVSESLKSYVVRTLCVLDFFVHSKYQRQENGRALFNFMLEHEQCVPDQMAVDKPSGPMLQFVSKHYHLTHPVWQTNNFVVYPTFFDYLQPTDELQHSRSQYLQQLETPAEDDDQYQEVSERRGSGQTSVGKLLRGNLRAMPQAAISPETPRGLRNSRDFSHQCIW